MKLVDQFSIDCHVHHHQMSPVATKHSLLAVAGDSGEYIAVEMVNLSSVFTMHSYSLKQRKSPTPSIFRVRIGRTLYKTSYESV